MKTFCNLLFYLSMTMVLSLSACSDSESDVLTTIPSDATFVIKINAEQVLESTGCKNNDGKWSLSESVERLCNIMSSSEHESLDRFMAALPTVDAENIFIYLYDSNVVLTCAVKHPSQLADALEDEFGKPERKNNFKVYNDAFILRGNQLWMSQDIDKLTESLNAADKKSASDMPALSYLRENKAAISASINYAAILKNYSYAMPDNMDLLKDYKDCYANYIVRFDANKMYVDGSMVKPDGKMLSMEGKIAPIDPAFEKFMPADPILAFAIGKPSENQLKAYLCSMGLPASLAASPFINANIGTTAFAIAMPTEFDNLLRLSEWNATLSVQYDRDKAEEIIEQVSSLSAYGLNISQLPDQIRVNIPWGIRILNPANFYIGYFDGALVASTQRITTDHSNGLAKTFKGHYGAGILEIPANSEIVREFKLPFGITCTAKYDNEYFRSECELTGSKLHFLESILSVVTDRKIHRNAIEVCSRLQEKTQTE